MKELFIIISSNYKGPVPSKLKKKLKKHFRDSKMKALQILARYIACQKNCKYGNIV